MDPLILLIEPDLDERAAAATMSRAQRVYEEGARDISRVMRDQLTEGTQAAGRGFDELETKARRSYLAMQDAAEKVAAAERKHEAARERGAANTEALARRVERARLDEIQAIERATQAYRDYEQAAQSAGEEGSRSFVDGMRGAVGQAGGLGQDFADGLMGGFAGAGVASRLAGLAVPGAGWVAAGLTAGLALAQGVSQGLESLQAKDLFQARLGIDESTMAQYGQAAGAAYADMWGASVQDNLRAVQFAVQGGVISPGASDEEIQSTIANMQTLAAVMEVDVQEAARATGQLIRGGFASSGEEAADIIASGFQNGLDIAGDWLDTVTEYTTQFRKLGLDGSDALGLIQQGLQGAARDSDVVADSLKEFSIRSVDGSELTAEGFAALGLNADDMAARFLKGGESARQAFGVTLGAIRSLDDPIQQALTWQALFGTQWEDMGDAINQMDLATARSEFGSTEGAISSMTSELSEHTNQWDVLGRNIDATFSKFKEWLADSAIGRFLNGDLPAFLNMPFTDYPMPGPTSYTNPDAAPDTPLNPLDIITGGGAPGAGGTPKPAGPGGLLLPSLGGPPPPAGAGAPGAPPVPGDRTPILTDTQQKAADEAAGGSSKSLPPAPVLPMQYRSTAGMDSSIASAMNRQDEVNHEIAEKEARLNQLKASNVATAEDIQKAENDLTKAENDKLKADQALVDAQTRAAEAQGKQLNKASTDLSGFFAEIDQDFGVSEGLPGIAENITKFLMNLAIAPAMAQLGMNQMAAGFAPGEAGSGLFGMMANSGAFGSQFVGVPSWARGGSSGGYGSGSGYPGVGIPGMPFGITPGGGTAYEGVPIGTSGDVTNQPGLDLLRSMGLKGTTYGGHTTDGAATDREIDVTDPTGGNSLARLAEFARQNPSLFEEFIYSDPLTGQKTGIRSGQLVGPGTSQPGYYSGNWAGHQDHAHIEPAKGGGLGFGDGPDGGGDGGNALTQSLYQDETGRWRSSLPGWDQLIQRESSGINQRQGIIDANSGGNEAEGLFQITPQTWAANGGSQFAPSALSASPYDQAQVAANIFGRNPSGSDWGMGLPGRENPAQLMAEIQGANPAMLGMPGMNNLGSGPSQSVTGGRAYGAGLPASSGASWSGGGLIGSALSGAMGAAGGAAGGFGGGAAAAGSQMAMQLLGRAAGAAGQYAGNAVGGVLETFMLNGSALGDPSSSWVGRILGGIAGVRPSLPNTAGEMGGKDNPNMAEAGKKPPPGPLTPQQAEAQQKAMGAAAKAGKGGDGTTINNNVNVTNNRATEDGTGQAIQAHLNAGQAAVQPVR